MNYSVVIKVLRKKLLLTQQELADLLGVSYVSVIDGKMEFMNQL